MMNWSSLSARAAVALGEPRRGERVRGRRRQFGGRRGPRGALGLAAALGGWFALARLARVLGDARRLCAAVSDGDFETRLLRISEQGETGEFLHEMNDMADKIDAFFCEATASLEAMRKNYYFRRIMPDGLHGALLQSATTINEAADAVEARVSAFDASTEGFGAEIGAIVNKLATASNGIGGLACVLGAGSGATGDSVRALGSASQDAAASVTAVKGAADALAGSAENVGASVRRTADIAHEAVQAAHSTGQAVEGLSAAVARIGEVVGLINEIAGQTNLLALNATIEAARAGEAARASRWSPARSRRWPTQTARATDEIAALIAEVEQATHAAVASTGEIGARIADIDQVTGAALPQIEGQVRGAGEMAAHLETTVARTRQVLDFLAQIEARAVEGLQLAQNVTGAADAIGAEGGRLNATVKDFLVSCAGAARSPRQRAARTRRGRAAGDIERRVRDQGVRRQPFRQAGAGGDLTVGGAAVLRFMDGHEVPATVKWVHDNQAGVALPPGSVNAALLDKLRKLKAA